MTRSVVVCILFLITIAMAVGAALASTGGADAGYSGGHVGGGWNCTACHDFNPGMGGVELLGAPKRYVSGRVYDLTVRVFDPEQAGGGFQISAESATGHQGTLIVSDQIDTQYADNGTNSAYVTHTSEGFERSLTEWLTNGGSDYHLRWVAPTNDVGPITFFTAGNAVNHAQSFFGDRFYATYAIAHFAEQPDSDGDEDVDLFDFAAFQRCYDAEDPATPPGCDVVDVSPASFVAVLDGPTATTPAGHLLADPVRGGLLYDKWWAVAGVATPSGNHPLYPPAGSQSGSSTFRCKECHGWDYKGDLGAYGDGSSHYTGIPGVLGSTLTPQELFDLLSADPEEVSNGHDMDAYGMTDEDLWDVVRMTLEDVVLTDLYIDDNGLFRPVAAAGAAAYNDSCSTCHGIDGDVINFGTDEAPEYIGALARRNPWEFLHKTRFGHPASPMPSSELLLWSVTKAAEVGAFSATLP